MPSFRPGSSIHNGRPALWSGSPLRRPGLAAAACVVIAALSLVACSPGGASQQVRAAPASTPTVIVSQRLAAPLTTALGLKFSVLSATDGMVTVPVAGLSDGKARFYSVRSGEKLVPFFVVQGADGVIRAALDACDVCFESRLGFRQEGDVMICNACGNRFPVTLVNVERGGCNPVGLNAAVRGDQVTIQFADLEVGARYF